MNQGEAEAARWGPDSRRGVDVQIQRHDMKRIGHVEMPREVLLVPLHRGDGR